MPALKVIIKTAVKTITNTLLVLYPLVIFLSLHYGYFNLAVFCLITILGLRLLMLPSIFSHTKWFIKITSYLGLFLAISSWLLTQYQLLLYYPVVINLALFILFYLSLRHPPTIIERFAKMQYPQLPEKAIRYTRKVTICWCFFFVLNGTVALVTCIANNLNWWTIYNGGISYVLIAILMGGEWLIRKRYQD